METEDAARRREIIWALKLGVFSDKEDLLALLGVSNYISDSHMENLRDEAVRQGLDVQKILNETDKGCIFGDRLENESIKKRKPE